jgi:ABC-type phosphate transport system substrate-binding protein
MAGSSYTGMAVQAWADGYAASCPNQKIEIDATNGTEAGLQGVCADPGSPVKPFIDVGNYVVNTHPNLPADDNEVATLSKLNGFTFDCVASNRQIIKVFVGEYPGVLVVPKRLEKCIKTLGGGFTVTQARWIFSADSIQDLDSYGWEPDPTDFFVGDLVTADNSFRKWSYLSNSSDCPNTDIFPVSSENKRVESLLQFLLADTPAGDRVVPYTKTIQEAIQEGLDFVGVTSLDYLDQLATDTFAVVKIKNPQGEYVSPLETKKVQKGQYRPFSIKLASMIWKQKVNQIKHLFAYGYSVDGDTLLTDLGVVPLSDRDKTQMRTILDVDGGLDLSSAECSTSNRINFDGSPIVAPIAELWAQFFATQCGNVRIRIQRSSASNGFRRFCGTGAGLPAIDVALSNRLPLATEATVRADGFTYDCVSNPFRPINMVQVATDADENPLYMGVDPSLVLEDRGGRNIVEFGLSDVGSNDLLLEYLSPDYVPLPAFRRNDIISKQFPNVIIICFPGKVKVDVFGKGPVPLRDVKIGDMIKTSGGIFEPVYSFAHYDRENYLRTVEIHTEGFKDPFLSSEAHLVLINGKMKAAAAVVVGDKLTLENGQSAIVTSVKLALYQGAYAPFTFSGTVVVNGHVASTYSTLQGDNHRIDIGGIKTLSIHWLSHLYQARHRMACRLNFDYFCAGETYSNDGFSLWIDSSYRFTKWLLRQNPLIMVPILVPYLIMIFVFASIEAIVMNPTASLPVFITVCYFFKASFVKTKSL